MAQPEKSTQRRAAEAVDGLDALARAEVLGWLCNSSPDAVLEAVWGLAEHRAVVARLLQRGPVADAP